MKMPWTRRLAFLSLHLPLVCAITLFVFGQAGPTLLYLSPGAEAYLRQMGEDWHGVGRLSRTTWSSMSDDVVRYDGIGDAFMGGFAASPGEMMIAVGPDAIALAACLDRPHGYLRSRVYLPHGVLLLGAGVCGVAAWFRVFIPRLGRASGGFEIASPTAGRTHDEQEEPTRAGDAAGTGKAGSAGAGEPARPLEEVSFGSRA